MPVKVERRDFFDFEALQNIVQDGPTDVVQIGRGRMTGALTHTAVDAEFDMTHGEFTTGVRLDGVPSQARWLLGMALSINGPASAQSREMLPGSLLMVQPGQERYSSYHGATGFATTLVKSTELEAFLAAQPGAYDVMLKQPGVNVLASDSAATADRIAQMSMLTTTLASVGPGLSEGAVNFYKRSLLDLVTAPVRETRYQGGHLRSADRLVREADRYMTEIGNRPVHISELCERFKVPRRTLHRAFIDVLGMAPVAFMTRKRLGDIHAALLVADDPVNIAAIANAHGFIGLGRFAATYRRTFGELPSATLRRRR